MSAVASATLRQQASAHYAARRWQAALDLLHQAIEADPGDARGFAAAGLMLEAMGLHGRALPMLAHAVALDPARAETRNAHGLALMRQARLPAAEAEFLAAAALDPRGWAARLNLGLALQRQQRHAESLQWLVDSCALAGAAPEPFSARATAHLLLRQPRAAETACREALRRRPGMVEALANLGLALREQDRLAEARQVYDQALAIDPAHHQSRWNRGLVDLLRGELAAGWDGHEARWQVPGFPSAPRGFAQPLWQGELIAGARLLLHAEQGFGDTIQMLRYLPLVAAAGAMVTLEVPAPLRRLVAANLPDGWRLVTRGDPLPDSDWQCPLFSLPRAFGTVLESIPAPRGYLHPPAETAAAWRRRLPADGGPPRIGLVWAGRPTHANDANRSLGLAQLAPVLALAGLRFLSLQAGPRAAEAAGVPGLQDLSPLLTDFAETAGAIAALDMVVGVDTAVQHLAGALGCPGLMLVPFAPDWRWLQAGAESPWYAGLRLFRQQRPGDWTAPIARLAEALDGCHRAHALTAA